MLAISIPHAITYFADADESDAPVSYKKQTWELVKKGIKQAVSDYLKWNLSYICDPIKKWLGKYF